MLPLSVSRVRVFRKTSLFAGVRRIAALSTPPDGIIPGRDEIRSIPCGLLRRRHLRFGGTVEVRKISAACC